jgi:hypothetical protein
MVHMATNDMPQECVYRFHARGAASNMLATAKNAWKDRAFFCSAKIDMVFTQYIKNRAKNPKAVDSIMSQTAFSIMVPPYQMTAFSIAIFLINVNI